MNAVDTNVLIVCSTACLEAGVTTRYTEDIGAPRRIESLELVNPF
ncbi:PIN domain-containing protein [Aeoliella mucimassa]|uniref:PIN domain-containing protein n=1 Tax=Aeoliella mucimassa TaxID=2527972 RepID=A0A518AH77_9BACT|nr:PIN domain-containing protein [Aeoliella mucimassa]QDU54085.1 hypothetical protein Pan181_02650 [Aeoliella mucimassa]